MYFFLFIHVTYYSLRVPLLLDITMRFNVFYRIQKFCYLTVKGVILFQIMQIDIFSNKKCFVFDVLKRNVSVISILFYATFDFSIMNHLN